MIYSVYGDGPNQGTEGKPDPGHRGIPGANGEPRNPIMTDPGPFVKPSDFFQVELFGFVHRVIGRTVVGRLVSRQL